VIVCNSDEDVVTGVHDSRRDLGHDRDVDNGRDFQLWVAVDGLKTENYDLQLLILTTATRTAIIHMSVYGTIPGVLVNLLEDNAVFKVAVNASGFVHKMQRFRTNCRGMLDVGRVAARKGLLENANVPLSFLSTTILHRRLPVGPVRRMTWDRNFFPEQKRFLVGRGLAIFKVINEVWPRPRLPLGV